MLACGANALAYLTYSSVMKKNSFKTLILIKLFFLISDALDKISWIVYLRQAFSARQMITCKGQALLIILLLVSDKKLQH
jgi:hypothetical protein